MIDEVSALDTTQIGQTNERLKQVANRNTELKEVDKVQLVITKKPKLEHTPFGGLSVILVADMRQASEALIKGVLLHFDKQEKINQLVGHQSVKVGNFSNCFTCLNLQIL